MCIHVVAVDLLDQKILEHLSTDLFDEEVQ
jgi:hypothetical protein